MIDIINQGAKQRWKRTRGNQRGDREAQREEDFSNSETILEKASLERVHREKGFLCSSAKQGHVQQAEGGFRFGRGVKV
jgi:hypothetical protein